MEVFISTKSTRTSFLIQNSGIATAFILTLIACAFFLTPHQIAIAQTVHIPDPNLRALVESALSKEPGEDITQADMASLEVLQANNCQFLTLVKLGFWWKAKRWICQSADDTFEEYGIQDLTGLEFAINLTELHLGRNQISDISPLKNLTNLTYLSLGRNQISDISPLKNLTNLTHLFLIYNKISDISPLKNLTNLVELDFEENQLSDVAILQGLTNLRHLSLRQNEISDISPLKNLTNLIYLSLRENKISDVSPLKNLTNLTYLHIGFNYTISDISSLENLTNLRHLQLDHNKISDVSPLKNLTNLRHLDASDNDISDMSPLTGLTKLAWLDLDTIKRLDLSQLKYFTNLTFLDIHDNAISDLTPLKDLTKLQRLGLDNNAIFDVSPLAGLTNLTELDLSGNQISDVSPLKNLINLKVLDLSNNQISDFSPLAGLTENLTKYNTRNQTLPSFKAADVNQDGIVNIIDLILVSTYFHNPDFEGLDVYPDVNGDGVVDIKDLVAVAAEISATPASPILDKKITGTSILTAKNLKQWIQLAKQIDTQVAQTQKAIAVLEQLLEALTLAEMLPRETALLANYPNPFNPETWIPYQLSKPAKVSISIHSVDGQLIRRLKLGQLPAGIYHNKPRAAYWDGRNEFGESIASGVYFYTFTADDFKATRKMIIRK